MMKQETKHDGVSDFLSHILYLLFSLSLSLSFHFVLLHLSCCLSLFIVFFFYTSALLCLSLCNSLVVSLFSLFFLSLRFSTFSSSLTFPPPSVSPSFSFRLPSVIPHHPFISVSLFSPTAAFLSFYSSSVFVSLFRSYSVHLCPSLYFTLPLPSLSLL